MFNAKVRFVSAAALAGTCFSVSLAAQTRSTKPHVQIRVFNLARVPTRDLLRAEAEVTRILAEADIDVRWAEGAVDDSASLSTDFSANDSPTGGCKVAGNAGEVRLQLLPHTRRGFAPGTVGFSLPCAKFGVDSTVFIDQCEAVTYHTLASFRKVLAYAIAHELGHVLLRSSEHTQTGLMRALWDKNAWIRATVSGFPIDPEQARRMRVELFRMAALTPEAPSK